MSTKEKITPKEIDEFLEICKKLDYITNNAYSNYEYYDLKHYNFKFFIKAVLEVRKNPVKFFLHIKETYISNTEIRKELLHNLIKYKDKL